VTVPGAGSLRALARAALAPGRAYRVRRLRQAYPGAVVAPGAVIGREVRLGPGTHILNADLLGPVEVGRGSFVVGPTRIAAAAGHPITIGAFCSVAGFVAMTSGNHPLATPATYATRNGPFAGVFADVPSEGGAITVGPDVWVASHAVVMAGVSVGAGAVIAAGAVVTRDVPPYAIVAGVPARVVRYRFEPHVVEWLLRLRWWDWADERIRANAGFFRRTLPGATEADLRDLERSLAG